MAKRLLGKNMQKKGLSAVVAAMILVGIVVAMISVVWVVVNNLVETELEEAGSCSDIFGKVTINPLYTCYNSSSTELDISVSVGDIDVNELLVSVAAGGSSNSFTLTQTPKAIPEINNGVDVVVPSKNSGRTFTLNMTAAGLSGTPNVIELSPKIGNSQCSVSSSVTEIPSCLSLVS